LLEAKSNGLVEKVEPLVNRLEEKGLWISENIKQRILKIADETPHN
jgi:predicted nucleic acid-binding protein